MTFYFFVQLKEWMNTHQRLVVGLLVVMIGVLSGVLIWQQSAPQPSEALLLKTTAVETTSSSTTEQTPTTTEEVYYVDIKGAVHSPGVYQLSSTSRVYDALQQAGGLTVEADEARLNLAQKVTDQMVIYVPKKGEGNTEEIATVSTVSLPSSNANANQSAIVHLNRATLEELQTLNGIGKKKAEAILQYRTEHGSFHSIEELQQVKGIGPKAFEKLKDQVAL